MAEQQQDEGSVYGYQNDDVRDNPFDFGLNAGKTYLKKFEWINNGGKQGAEQEALEIIFLINDVEKSKRTFPFVGAYPKGETGGQLITDPNDKIFKDGLAEYRAGIVHILKAFAPQATIEAALSRRFKDFKEYCTVCQGILPKDFSKKKLDIFLQYQYNIPEGKDRTYLDIPSKLFHGHWLVPAKPGKWVEHRAPEPFPDTLRKALWYTNEKGEEHPFTRKGWFMNHNFGKQQKPESGSAATGGGTTADETAAGEAQNSSGEAAAW